MAGRDDYDRPLPPLRIASVRDASRNGQGSEKKEKEKRGFFSRGKSSGEFNTRKTSCVRVFEACVALAMNISA